MAGIKKVGPCAYKYDDEHVDELELAKGIAEALRQENLRLQRTNGNLEALLEREHPEADAQIAEMFGLMREMNEDEAEIALMVARKLVGEGKEEHGAMNLRTDDRDLLGEALDEVTDGLTYVLMRLLKERR